MGGEPGRLLRGRRGDGIGDAVWKLADQLFLEGLPDSTTDAVGAVLRIAWQAGGQVEAWVDRAGCGKAAGEGRVG